MLSKRFESTEDDRRTWLHVSSGTHWSTSSDTNQVVEIPIDTSANLKLYTPFLIGLKFSIVFVALIYTLSHNTRHIAFPNLELTCNIAHVHDNDMWPSKLATYMIYQPWLRMSQVWRKYTQLFTNIS